MLQEKNIEVCTMYLNFFDLWENVGGEIHKANVLLPDQISEIPESVLFFGYVTIQPTPVFV